MSIVAAVVALSVPALSTGLDTMRLRTAVRDVERQLHEARIKAVQTNRPMRVVFNCPAPGRFRMVELLGTPAAPDAADNGADRCSEARYPYPAPDQNPMTLPNHDGPVGRVHRSVSFTVAPVLEFWPDGTTHANLNGGASPWPAIPPAGITLTLTKGTRNRSLVINGFGRVQVR